MEEGGETAEGGGRVRLPELTSEVELGAKEMAQWLELGPQHPYSKQGVPANISNRDKKPAEPGYPPAKMRRHEPQVQGENLLQRNRQKVIEEDTRCPLLAS